MNANWTDRFVLIGVHSWLENSSPNCGSFNLSSTKGTENGDSIKFPRENARFSNYSSAAEMPLLRSQLRTEPEEVNVASGAVAMGRSGMAGRNVCAGRMPTLRCAQISIDAQHHLTVGQIIQEPESSFVLKCP